MRIKTICTALAALILAACNSEIVEDHSDYDEYWYDLTVGLPDSRTKVSEKNSPGTPNAVNTLQVLVFDDGGKLEASSIQEAETAVLTCKAGAKKVVTLPTVNTIADGTAVKTPGSLIFPYIKEHLDDIITVEDDELVVSFLDMVENHKMVVENSGLLKTAPSVRISLRIIVLDATPPEKTTSKPGYSFSALAVAWRIA